LKVRIDEDVCAGFGLCNERLPEVFGVDDLGFGQVERDGVVPLELHEAARHSIADCPAHAISSIPVPPTPSDSGGIAA
jgi:ferredoxin